MEVPSSNDVVSICNDEEKALQCLLDAFGSCFSLQAIASAYSQAGRNAHLAGQILRDMQGTGPCADAASISSDCKSNGDEEFLKNPTRKLKAVKQKWRPVSAGTVSSLLGKDYVRSLSEAKASCEATKPLKLDAKELPMCELWGEEGEFKPSRNDRMRQDMEDFMFKMLGHGFQLERDAIRQVLDKCGYDMQKSMEKLLDLSALNLDKRSKHSSKSTEKGTGVYPNFQRPSYQKELQPMDYNGRSTTSTANEQEKARNDLQKELLSAFFDSTKKSDKLSRSAKDKRRSLVYGELVTEPPRDFILECKVDSVDLQQDNNKNEDEDEDDSYQLLRRAVKEHRGTMKEYYEAAVAAFAKGDYDLANKLMDQGHFFREKAREADEESSQKIFETKNVETQEKMMLDLHDYGAKEAIRQLKCHISSLAGIPPYKYLKVVIETDEEDITKGARRRLVMKLLERESIKWTEGENDGTILIHLDTINPKRLSFAKK